MEPAVSNLRVRKNDHDDVEVEKKGQTSDSLFFFLFLPDQILKTRVLSNFSALRGLDLHYILNSHFHIVSTKENAANWSSSSSKSHRALQNAS